MLFSARSRKIFYWREGGKMNPSAMYNFQYFYILGISSKIHTRHLYILYFIQAFNNLPRVFAIFLSSIIAVEPLKKLRKLTKDKDQVLGPNQTLEPSVSDFSSKKETVLLIIQRVLRNPSC